MDAVKEWAVAVCAAAVLSAAVGMLTNGGSSAKSMRFLLSVVMLCLLIEPLGSIKECADNVNLIISGPVEDNNRLLNAVEDQTVSYMSRSVSELIDSELDAMGVYAQKIQVNMDISEDGCITIGQVVITVNEEDHARADELSTRIYDRLGLNARFIVPEEKG